MTNTSKASQAPTDAEFLAGYEQHLADQATALLARLPQRRRSRKAGAR